MIQIATFQLPRVNAFVEKQNKRAIKLGFEPAKLVFSEPYVKQVAVNDKWMNVEFVDVSVDDQQIKLGDYKFVGRIDDVEGEKIVSGVSDMKKYRNVSMSRCDHCNINRNRNHLVVISDGVDEKVVGSSCLVDFTGHQTALSYVSSMSWLFDLEQTFSDEGFFDITEHEEKTAIVFDINLVLQYAAAIIRLDNRYISRATQQETGLATTKQSVISVLLSTKPDQVPTITDQDIEYAKNALEWFFNTEHPDTDFFYNLSTLLNKSYISMKFVGYVVALLPIYFVAKEKEKVVPSEFIGNVGDKKVELELTCIRVFSFPIGYNRYSVFYLFKTGNNIVKYATTSINFEVGETYKLIATIKSHDVYNDVKQTVITRAKLI